jgi:myo-inositol-1-phosphate synthase
MDKIETAIVGVGNCAGSPIQGINYYREVSPDQAVGLMHPEIGGFRPYDIEVAVTFDVDQRKVGRPVAEAAFAKPNCTKVFCDAIEDNGVKERLDDENIHVGPSDYAAWQKDNKICFLRLEGRIFGGVLMNIELRLSVEDSPNSAGIVIDVIRCCKLALEANLGGVLHPPSAYSMKHPPAQFTDDEAFRLVEAFIQNPRVEQSNRNRLHQPSLWSR